jgi:hypothetical protein
LLASDRAEVNRSPDVYPFRQLDLFNSEESWEGDEYIYVLVRNEIMVCIYQIKEYYS